MQKRYYYDKNSGIILLLLLLFVILPIITGVLAISMVGFLFGISLVLVGGFDIWIRILILIPTIVVPVLMVTATVCVIKFFGKIVYLCLHSIKMDDEGITSCFFCAARKHWSWDEVTECSTGWDCDRLARNNKPLSEGIEKFAYDRHEYLCSRGTKYIYFSTKKLTETEKMELFFGQLKKDYLIAVKHSPELSEYLHSMDRFGSKETVTSETSAAEKLQNSRKMEDEKIKFTQFADKKTGMLYLISVLSLIYFALLSVTGLCTIGFSKGVFLVGLFLTLTTMFLLGAVIFGRYVQRCLRRITVDSEGVRCRNLLGKIQRWRWSEIKECGVIRDNSPQGKAFLKDVRYIFFSQMPVFMVNEKTLIQQFKRRDVIFVLYSEELYQYLYGLGVMGER